MFCKKGVLRNFKGKHLCQSRFFNKVAGLRLRPVTLLKKRLWHRFFSCEFCEISKNTFSYRAPPATASYLNKIRSYLKNIINNLKIFATWKVHLTKTNNFISSIDNDEERVMHSKSDNVEIMINYEAD